MSASLKEEFSSTLDRLQKLADKIPAPDYGSDADGNGAVDWSPEETAGSSAATRPVSGVYERRGTGLVHDPSRDDDLGVGIDALATRDQIRLDVDGRYPQMTISGTVSLGPAQTVHWIARLVATGPQKWEGPIWYKDGAVSFFPFTSVKVKTSRLGPLSSPVARVTYLSGVTTAREQVYRFSSACYRSVQLEYDSAEGVTAETSMNTHDHPDRPASLPAETISIETVFRRAGFNVKKSGGDSTVPLSGAGSDAVWSDMEMHDAMQAFWSQFSNAPNWAAWVFFAAMHEMGSGLGGIMFDDIGPNHRQGTAIFNDSFISSALTGDLNAAAWVRRMKFWTAVHETGHAFNLAHSWQKALGTPWIPLANEPTALSFMNYPFNFSSEKEFFDGFEFRFSDTELLFLRHAPERFVQMGNAAWFDHHGFEQNGAAASKLQLTLRVNRDKPVFEYLEPVIVELKLQNRSAATQVIDGAILNDPARMTFIIKKSGREARQLEPFAHRCEQPRARALAPGESQYESLFVSAGSGGWEISDPGEYTLQVACVYGDQQVVSNPLRITVAGPQRFEEVRLAHEVFTDDVARILTFGGSKFLAAGNEALARVAEELPDRRIAIHAQVALANPMLRDYKSLSFPSGQGTRVFGSAASSRASVRVSDADPADASQRLQKVVKDDATAAAESLGHVGFRKQVESQARLLASHGMMRDAAQLQEELADTLEERHVRDDVIRDIRERAERYAYPDEGEAAPLPKKRRK